MVEALCDGDLKRVHSLFLQVKTVKLLVILIIVLHFSSLLLSLSVAGVHCSKLLRVFTSKTHLNFGGTALWCGVSRSVLVFFVLSYGRHSLSCQVLKAVKTRQTGLSL